MTSSVFFSPLPLHLNLPLNLVFLFSLLVLHRHFEVVIDGLETGCCTGFVGCA